MTSQDPVADETIGGIRRYLRANEAPVEPAPEDVIPAGELEAALARSDLTPGGRELARALLRTARPQIFPGGGLGIEYGPLLKTAARPDLLAAHIAEVVQHLRDRQIDLLVVPGMSGYPIGSMYSAASGIPAVLLKKQLFPPDDHPERFPPGSFVIPSYTGSGDTIISADLAAVRDIIATILERKRAENGGQLPDPLTLRIAGADEIIDKATMATAITETAPIFCRSVAEELLVEATVNLVVTVEAWVTPIVKGYNRSAELLTERFGIVPFAGATITSLHLDPPAIGLAGLGVVTVH
jgi:hypothetical protein